MCSKLFSSGSTPTERHAPTARDGRASVRNDQGNGIALSGSILDAGTCAMRSRSPPDGNRSRAVQLADVPRVALTGAPAASAVRHSFRLNRATLMSELGSKAATRPRPERVCFDVDSRPKLIPASRASVCAWMEREFISLLQEQQGRAGDPLAKSVVHRTTAGRRDRRWSNLVLRDR